MKIWEVELMERGDSGVLSREVVKADDFITAANKASAEWNVDADGKKRNVYVSSVRVVAETTVGE